MNKHRYTKIIFFGIVLTAVFWYGWTQAEPANSESEQNSTSEGGRDNPFESFFGNGKSAPQKASQTSQLVGERPELSLETITLKSLSAESFKSIIAGMSSPYGSVSIDKNSNTLIIYDTKEALAKMKDLVPPREIVAENRIPRSYRIVYANIDEVEHTLRTFISNSGQLSANPSTGNILVVDFESNIKIIDSFINEIDRLMQQVLVEVRIYDVTSTEGFQIGAEWYAGRNTPITAIEDTDTYQRIDTTTGPTNTWEQTITDTVDTVDPTNTGTITETKTTIEPATTGYGITDTREVVKDKSTSWRENAAGVAMPYRKSKPFVGGEFDAEAGGTIRFGLLNTVDVELVLNVLRSEVGAKLLANPRILVLDNETAEFEIVSEIPYTEQSDTSQGGSLTSIQFKEVGTKLKVTPHVTRDGMIRLQIAPEFGVVTEKGSKVAATALGTVPTVDTRRIDTKALVQDGQTVVIGGLRKRTVTQTIKKIPFLGDTPLLGQLFSDTQEEVKTNELLIFITPRIVATPTLSQKEVKKLEATEFEDPKIIPTEYEKAEKAEK